jgi:hypothetical protein
VIRPERRGSGKAAWTIGILQWELTSTSAEPNATDLAE